MNSKLSNIIFNDIQRDIILGEYPVKTKLPPERELTLKYNTNRPAIREAIAMLVQSGFVQTNPQSGTIVKDFRREASLEMLVQILKVSGTIEKQTLESLLEYRYHNETKAAEVAAKYITSEDIEYLQTILVKKNSNFKNLNLLSQLDFDFHYYITTISRNIISQIVFKSFKPIYSFFTHYFYSLEGAPERSLLLNKKLINALEKKDTVASKDTMKKILKHGTKKIYSAINYSKGDLIILNKL